MNHTATSFIQKLPPSLQVEVFKFSIVLILGVLGFIYVLSYYQSKQREKTLRQAISTGEDNGE